VDYRTGRPCRGEPRRRRKRKGAKRCPVSRTQCSVLHAAPQSRDPPPQRWTPDQQRITEPVLGPREARTRVQMRRAAQHPGNAIRQRAVASPALFAPGFGVRADH
jgi:hypothetical protein